MPPIDTDILAWLETRFDNVEHRIGLRLDSLDTRLAAIESRSAERRSSDPSPAKMEWTTYIQVAKWIGGAMLVVYMLGRGIPVTQAVDKVSNKGFFSPASTDTSKGAK